MALVTKVVVAADAPAGAGENHSGDLRFGRRLRPHGGRDHGARESLRWRSKMLDGVMLRMVEEATHAGFPMDAAAVLLIELEGLRESVEEQVSRFAKSARCAAHASFALRVRRKNATCFGKGRKNAFGAVAVSAPATMCRTAWCLAPGSRRRCD